VFRRILTAALIAVSLTGAACAGQYDSQINLTNCMNLEATTVIKGTNALRTRVLAGKSLPLMSGPDKSTLVGEIDSRQREAIDAFTHAVNKVMMGENVDCDDLAKRAMEYISEPLTR
jgi:hypothetical protein